MNELSSTEFRKTYAKLTEQTVITVNGHAIGLWTPAGGVSWTVTETHAGPNGERVIDKIEGRDQVTPQQARDDLLRKINRGK